MKSIPLLALIGILFCFSGCKKETEKEKKIMAADPHSYAIPDEAKIVHLSWNAEVNFETRTINAEAIFSIEKRDDAGKIILDTKNLNITSVSLNDEEAPAEFTVQAEDEVLGSALHIAIKKNTSSIKIKYSTREGAEALQWLEPIQTAGGEFPFLFTQSQAILARSWIPIQDSPGIRFTYDADVKVPNKLMALMSASNPQAKNDSGIYHFEMRQPIPAYLMALAVGDIEFRQIGPRTGVYSEPSILENAAYEFAEMEEMLTTAENLYGPYKWDRYDLIVLPPSFPFGGMENPRLTFATPTVLAGDRSLTSLVAHELAHSWSGNLVTNATWNDFWLNEGFTVYFENRIMEEMNGSSYAQMLAGLSLQELQEEVETKMSEGSGIDTRLKLQLEGRNPDEGVSSIAYDKGFFFLKFLEGKVGREKLDEFLKNYFAAHEFQSMTTEAFLDYLDENLGSEVTDEEVNQWVYSEGIPATLPKPDSERFRKVDQILSDWNNGKAISNLITREDLIAKTMSTHEWLHFIRNLPEEMSMEAMLGLDNYLDFTHSGNTEILGAWFLHVIRNNYEPGYENLENFLISVGRRKFLVPLYDELIKTEKGLELAKRVYAIARPNYHFVSTNTLDKMLNWNQPNL